MRLFVWFYAVMAAAGLLTEGLFGWAGLIPSTRPQTIVTTHFEWNYTTVLNFAFLGALGVLYWLHRNRARFGGGAGYAFDPVCGMQVRTANAPAHGTFDRHTFFFCSDHCRERFENDPARFSATSRAAAHQEASPTSPSEDAHTAGDPVCGMTVDPAQASARRRHGDRDYFFCGTGCAEAFDANPERYADAARDIN